MSGASPYAMCYGGHQFGQWAGQLGDGRAINLGEVSDISGQRQLVQLKGAGPTPYSRHADGFAVLRSSVREFLCSEAMHHLGVPTTRALSLVLSGEQVERDMFYSGHPQMEPGAIVARVAPSFVRFGNFEIFAARGDHATLNALTAYVLQNEYPDIYREYLQDKPTALLRFFHEVCERTCAMIVGWMRVGFVHGVMNTDNMSILGLTIDYGPYGWLDNFDPTWTPNTTDAQQRRYRFENQPAVAQWNLLQLANALYPMIESTSELENIVRQFKSRYDEQWRAMMAKKLGISIDVNDSKKANILPESFFGTLEQLLRDTDLDMTLFYRALADQNIVEFCQAGSVGLSACATFLQPLSYTESLSDALIVQWQEWFSFYQCALEDSGTDNDQRKALMCKTNPAFIPQNFLVQEAIEAAHKSDYSGIEKLQQAMCTPYQDHPEFNQKRPDWALNKAGCSMLSCSS